jgi:hypothetical protein
VYKATVIGLALFIQLGLRVDSFSQTLKTKQIGLGTGISFNALNSELISPYNHKGSSAPFQLFFRSGKEISRHHFQSQYYNLDLTSSSNGLSTADEGGYMQYAYHRKVKRLWDKVTIYGGLLINAKASSRNNPSSNASKANNQSGELLASLNPSVLLEYPIRKNLLTIQFWSPVLTFLYQQGYALSPDGGNWVSLNKLGGLDCRISYDKFLSDRWSARFDYQFQFYRITKFETLSSLSNQLVVSLVYKIK